MGPFAINGLCIPAYILAASIILFFNSVDSGFSEELSAPDPFSRASSRLKDLSTFVDKHLQTVQTVSKAASNRTAANRNS